ncbi:MAG: hypothetical protein JO339_32380 [Alphaproteobacteria bacterium]|nr:hypothetical protein [Alphaproteobacteria bacterium]
MVLPVTGTTKFTDIYNEFKPGLFKSDNEHVRGGAAKDGDAQIYTRSVLTPNGKGEEALQRRQQQYKSGASLVKQAMANEYGTDVAEAALRRASDRTGRDLAKQVTRGDLNIIHQELQTLDHNLENLRRSIKQDSEETIKSDLAGTWDSTSNDVREIKCPGSDATVHIRDQVYKDYIQRGDMQFEEGTKNLKLSLTPSGAKAVDKIGALTRFIEENFGVKPEDAAFENVANNLLSYLHQGVFGGVTAKAVGLVNGIAADAGTVDGNGVESTFTLSADGNHDIRVSGETHLGYKDTRKELGVTSEMDFSIYKVHRQEQFGISGQNLTSSTDKFDAKASLLWVNRYDTVDLAS